MVARQFKYKPQYDSTPFLEKISLVTKSEVKNARFNVRLYQLNEQGEPAEFLYDQNIYGIARKGKKLTEIDLSDLYLTFPKQGLLVAIEWLIIDENAHQYNYTLNGSKEVVTGTSFEPSVGTVTTSNQEDIWMYSGGRWIRPPKNDFGDSKHTQKYGMIAMELTLSN